MRIAIACSISMMMVTGCCYGLEVPSAQEDAGLTASPVPAASTDGVLPPLPGTSAALDAHLERETFAALRTGPQPQVPDPLMLWDRATPHEGPIDRAMLVCRARLHGGGWDESLLAGGEDVSLVARFGDGELRESGDVPGRRMLTFPIRRLEPGATIWVRVTDVDLFFDDTIAEGTTTLTRAPFTMTMGQADVDCRVVPSALVASHAQSTVRTLAMTIDALGASEPDITAPDLGYPRDVASRTIEATRHAAAWVEWSDPELTREIDRAVAFESAWAERARRAVDVVIAQLPAAGTTLELSPGRRITATRRVCGPAANALREDIGLPWRYFGCLVLLTVETERPLRLGPIAAPAAWPFEGWMIDAHGQVGDTWIVARRDAVGWIAATEERVVAPGATIEIVLESAPQLDPVLLRLRDATSSPIVLRVD